MEKRRHASVESRLVKENHSVRVFVTDGPFCNGSYYSPQQEAIIPAVVSYNKKFHSITLSFEDGGKNLSAKEIVQSLWGPEAGGRDGIAGSPRGQEMTIEDLENATRTVEKAIREKEKEMSEPHHLSRSSDGVCTASLLIKNHL